MTIKDSDEKRIFITPACKCCNQKKDGEELFLSRPMTLVWGNVQKTCDKLKERLIERNPFLGGVQVKAYIVSIGNLATELRKPSLDDDKGVYFVCSATQNKERVFNIKRLLYIGRSNDVNKRINGKHHKHDAIISECEKDDAVPVSYYAKVTPNTKEDMVRVESALIFYKQTPLNDTANKEFHHPTTIIFLKRSADSINKDKPLPKVLGAVSFVVKRTAE